MRDLVKAGLSFMWAMPLLGTRELATWLSPGAGRDRRAAAGLDAVTRAASDGLLDQEGLLGRLYQLSQCAQEGLANLLPTLLTPELLYPSTWVGPPAGGARRALVPTRQLARGEGSLVLEELRAKGEVF